MNIDGIAGSNTVKAIKAFQRLAVGMTNPDGRIDPGGKTLKVLGGSALPNTIFPGPPRQPTVPSSTPLGPTGVPYFRGVQKPIWPVQTTHPKRLKIAPQDIRSKWRSRGFGARRDNGRRHQGVDLYGYHKDLVVAIADGVVVDNPRHFYHGTDRVLIRGEGGVILYGEIEHRSAQKMGLSKGKYVKAGDPVGRVGRMSGGSSMLHLEAYRTDITSRPRKRWYAGKSPPAELLDPTDLLQRAAARDREASGIKNELIGKDQNLALLPEIEAFLADSPNSTDQIQQLEFPALIVRRLSGSVGNNGINREDDVRSVQQLLNIFIIAGWLPGIGPLSVDGVVGPKVIAAIKAFQRVFVGMINPDGRVDPSGKTLAKLNGSVFQQPASAAAPLKPIATDGTTPSLVTGPVQRSLADIRFIAYKAGLTKAYQDFLTFLAYGESRGNNLTGLGIPGQFPPWTKTYQKWVDRGRPSLKGSQIREANAAAKGYRRNQRSLGGCWPEVNYTFGSGGWFGFLPSSGLAVFRNTEITCLHPWSIFDGPTSVVMAMGYIYSLQRRFSYKRNPTVLTLRIGFASPSKMSDVEFTNKRIPKYTRQLRAIGLSDEFLNMELPPLPAFDPLILMKRLGAILWLPR
ncbi:peptidoglycan-binding protein [Microbulbifer yueqingensis]|uniref:peptidoglycan-binding protein n=1 Tax=Microbulbifer yueqingensis TaxID=658219 RepID=UPI0015876FB7|nr:peptidoglycan-binding protein [Microbulbifer yueqingensis]